jgi:CheY-like chemotaxis protein
MLSNWGLKTTLADSGPAALQVLQRESETGSPIALVVADVQMPGMDGFTLAQQIQADPRLRTARIALLASGGRPGDADRSREFGVSACLVKPVGEMELLDAIVRMLQSPSNPGITRVSKPSRAPEESGPGLRLLVVEDNPVNRLVATRLLETRNHRVTAAANGREALEIIENEKFDCVLMDVQMPVLDGLRATAAIRSQERVSGGHLPIIAMTAHAMAGDHDRCLAAGMDGYLTKPVNARDVFATVSRVIEDLKAQAPPA